MLSVQCSCEHIFEVKDCAIREEKVFDNDIVTISKCFKCPVCGLLNEIEILMNIPLQKTYGEAAGREAEQKTTEREGWSKP